MDSDNIDIIVSVNNGGYINRFITIIANGCNINDIRNIDNSSAIIGISNNDSSTNADIAIIDNGENTNANINNIDFLPSLSIMAKILTHLSPLPIMEIKPNSSAIEVIIFLLLQL